MRPINRLGRRATRSAAVLLVSALLLGGLSFAPRGIEVTVRNLTEGMLDVRVESGHDIAVIRSIAPGGQGTAVVCPRHDSSILLTFDHGGRTVVRDIGVYTFHDAIGSAAATIHAGGGGAALPSIGDVCHDSGYSPWSLLPHGLFARGSMLGLAVGLVLAAWLHLGGPRRRRRGAAQELGIHVSGAARLR